MQRENELAQNISRRVIWPGIATLLIYILIGIWAALWGSEVAITPWFLFPVCSLLTVFVYVAIRLRSEIANNKLISTARFRVVTIANLIILSVPIIALSILLMLGALGAQMVGQYLGSFGLVLIAFLSPLLFFRSHWHALRVCREAHQPNE